MLECKLLCSITHRYASHLRPMFFFFFYLLSEAFLPESVSEQGQCSLRLLFLLICQVRSILIQACRRLSFLQSFFKEDFTHAFYLLHPQHTTQSNLPAQFPLLSANQSQCEKCHVLVYCSVNVKAHSLTCLAHDGSAWPDTNASHCEHCLHVINSTRM